jgi:hypothetical protein
MILLHATTVDRLKSIRTHGLLCSLARQKRRAVWFVSAHKTPWAVKHALLRGVARLEDIVVLKVRVPRSWIKGFRHKGLFYCERDVPPSRIVGSIRWGVVEE